MDSFDIFKKLSKGVRFENIKAEKRLMGTTEKAAGNINNDQIKRENIKTNINVSQSVDALPIEIKLEQGESTTKKKKTTNLGKEKELQNELIAHLRNVNHISVKGNNVPPPITNFEELRERYQINGKILKNLTELGYTNPTSIQMQAISVMAEGRQILACAPTGSGKTAAFLIPVLMKLEKPGNSGFRALVLCPTRELARQTYRECLKLLEGTGLKAHIISKVSLTSNKFGPNFSKKFDILISTPNRLIFLLRKEDSPLKLINLEWLVIDESDKLFEVGVTGFRDQLAEIYRACDSETLKRAMFSATHMEHLAIWCKKNLKGLVSVTVGVRNTAAEEVEQELLYVGREYGKLIAFRNLIQQGLPTPALVFVQSKERAKELFEELIYDGIYVDVIHADRTQLQRDNVVRAFREGKVWVLICTELMGRGIDFKGVKLVINYDFPQSAISYIHRIGRTGRAGRPGKAITFFTEDDKPKLKSIARVMKESGCPVPDYMLSLKKPSRSEQKKLERSVVKRKKIKVSFDTKNRKKRRKQVEKTGETI